MESYFIQSIIVLSYSSFLNLVLPACDNTLRKQVKARKAYIMGINKKLSFDVNHCLAKLLEYEIDLLRGMNKILLKLEQIEKNPIPATFHAIDTAGHSYFTMENLEIFMRTWEAGIITKMDIKAIFRRLDNDCDGKISFDEYVEGFSIFGKGATKSNFEKANRGVSYEPIASRAKKENFQTPSPKKVDYEKISTKHSASIKKKADKKKISTTNPTKTTLLNMKKIVSSDIAKVFTDQLDSRNKLEEIRKNCRDIGIQKIFKFLAKEGENFICYSELIDSFKRLGINLNNEINEANYIFLLFKNYDKDLDGLLNKKDIAGMINIKQFEEKPLDEEVFK